MDFINDKSDDKGCYCGNEELSRICAELKIVHVGTSPTEGSRAVE